MRTFFLYFITGVILSLLSACGFQLRNSNQLMLPSHTLYLQTDSPYGSFESNLKQTLHSSGITLADSAKKASIILQLSKPTESNTSMTAGPSSQSRAYSLVYQITYTLRDAHGKTLVGPETLATSRSLILSPNQLPQSNNQADVLKDEMERDLIRQLYNRLRSTQVEEALQLKSS